MSKIKVKLKGSFTNKSVAVDGWVVWLTGLGDTFTGEISIEPGEHKLDWAVQGMPGDTFEVALSGDTEDWSQTGLRIGNDGHGPGRYRFQVR